MAALPALEKINAAESLLQEKGVILGIRNVVDDAATAVELLCAAEEVEAGAAVYGRAPQQ